MIFLQGLEALSLLIQNIDLLEAREDDVEIAEIGEKEIYKVLAAMNNFYKLKPQFPDKELNVNFADFDFPINQQEDLQMRDWYINHNIKTPLDYMDTDLDEKQKMELLNKNKEINGNLTSAEKIRQNLQNKGVNFVPNG